LRLALGPAQGVSLLGLPGVAPPLAVTIHVAGAESVRDHVRVAVHASGFSSSRPTQPAASASGNPAPGCRLYSRASATAAVGARLRAIRPFTAERPLPPGCQKSQAVGSVSDPPLVSLPSVSSRSAGLPVGL
jgi:hypothetical protein